MKSWQEKAIADLRYRLTTKGECYRSDEIVEAIDVLLAEIARLQTEQEDRKAIAKEDQAETVRLQTELASAMALVLSHEGHIEKLDEEIARLRDRGVHSLELWFSMSIEINNLRDDNARLRKGWARAVLRFGRASTWEGVAHALTEVYDREVTVEEAREIEREVT